MEDRDDEDRPVGKNPVAEERQKVTRREAMKRIAKGMALVGSLGLTAAVVQGQGECGYVDYYTNSYYNYSNVYSNYSDYSDYYDYQDLYFNHHHDDDEHHRGGERHDDDEHHDDDKHHR
jgi:hypothetical protein